MFEKHFGLKEKPFELTPDPAFLYISPQLKETIATLQFFIVEKRGFLLLIGEPGTGKTTLLNTLIDWSESKAGFAYIFNPAFDFNDLLHMVLSEFSLIKEDETLPKRKCLRILYDYAINRYKKGKNTVIIVDEAQYLDLKTLESLRLLSNLETRKHKLIQIIIAGQPELIDTLSDPKIRQLIQRIALRRRTRPLNKYEVDEYLRHRLKAAGYSGSKLFSDRATQQIHEYSKGIPRTINIICDSALLIAYATNKKWIDTTEVEEAIEDLETIDIDADKKSARESNCIDERCDNIISMDKTEISAKKNQSLPKNNQKNSLLIGSSKIMQVSEPEKTDQSKRKKEIKKLYISRLSTAVLSTFIILSLGVGGIYLLTKNGFNHGTFEKIEEFDNTFDSLESSQFDNYKLKTKDTTTTALDNKLNELNKKVDVLNISLKEKKNLNKLHQIEISQTNSKYTKKGAAKDKEASAKESSIYSPNNQIKYLLVKKGDSLNEIIMREYGGLDEKVLSMILMSNPEIKDPNLINENQILRLPPKKYYELAEEDTNSQDIWKIEQRNW